MYSYPVLPDTLPDRARKTHGHSRHSRGKPVLLLLSLLLATVLLPADAGAQSVSFTNITTTSATINLSGSNAFYWSYRRTAPTTGSCHGKQAPSYSANLTGLTPTTRYTYRVWNGNGGCAAGQILEGSFTTLGPPPAPSKPTGSGRNGGVFFQWTSNGNGGSAITKWQYTKKVGNNEFETEWTDICVTASDAYCVNRVSVIVNGLAGGIAHKFKVRGVNTHGNGAESPESDAIAPNGTTTLAAVNVAQTEATLELSGYSGAWWYQGDQGGASCTAVPANTAIVNLSGLTPSRGFHNAIC